VKILSRMLHIGYLRNFECTVRLLAARGHHVELAFMHEKELGPHTAPLLDDLCASPRVTTSWPGVRGDGRTGDERRRFVEAFVRPHGADTPAPPILVAAIEELGRRRPEAAALLAPAAALGNVVRAVRRVRRSRPAKRAWLERKAQRITA
jgi:hypothetical protein